MEILRLAVSRSLPLDYNYKPTYSCVDDNGLKNFCMHLNTDPYKVFQKASQQLTSVLSTTYDKNDEYIPIKALVLKIYNGKLFKLSDNGTFD